MKVYIKKVTRTSILLTALVIGFVVILAILPFGFKSFAGGQNDFRSGLSSKTVSRDDKLENYDIRTDKSKRDVLSEFRSFAGQSASGIADVRDRFVAGENLLREKVPTLKVEYNDDLRIPEVIATDVEQGRAFLTSASKAKRADVLRQFVSDNDNLIGVAKAQVAKLKPTADYTNPDGNLSYASLEQTINGYPVFRGEIKAGFTKDGKMFRVINNLAPGLDDAALSTDFGDPFAAVKTAAANVNYELKDSELNQNYAVSDDLKAVFGTGDWATTAEKMYFPIEPGAARTAWRVLVWKPQNAYYVIVDAETGALLWRKNISADQTQTATYNVYASTTNMLKTLNNPAPIVPALNDPNSGTQGAVVPRSNVSLVGNEAPNTFNNLGWMTDNTNGANGTTDGNNVQAGLDIVSPNGIDATVNGTNRTFNFDYNPAPGNPAPGDAPTGTNFRNGAVTQLFYVTNRYHDELYKLGFTEIARNFQNDNFSRGGVAADRVSAESQDYSGTNNANFATPADGSRGRMQMYLFDGPNPDRDGDLDADVVAHELTHGTSNRLIGNGSGLNNNRGASMGEGWSDFYSLALLSNPNNPLAANYATGGYVSYLLTSNYTYNYYYGIRRFPYAIKSFTGGPNNRPHNPLTFADIDPAQISLKDGAYASNPAFGAGSATEVHNAGEVWCAALWEVRGQLINRLGAANGNLKSLQLVTDGMKMTPNNPNFVQARDAIIAAATANSAADAADVREGFRIRGMGLGAQDNGSAVVETFSFLNAQLTDPFTVSDASGNNDGFPEPGEKVLLSVAIINRTSATVNNVVANVDGGTNVSYGNIASGATVTMQIPYTIPANAACGSLVSVTINISSDAGIQSPEMRSFRLGKALLTFSENFNGVTAPALPTRWTSTKSGVGTGWTTSTTTPASAPNAAFAGDPNNIGSSDLESPVLNVTSSTARLDFKINYNTEASYDGAVLEIKIGSGAYQDIIAAGGSFNAGGYSATLNTDYGNPLAGRAAWTGNSGGYAASSVNLPAAANNQPVQFRWRMGSDNLNAGVGVRLDDVQLINGDFCSLPLVSLSVNKTDDTDDGVCDADCSLREALDVADSNGAPNIITFNIPANSPNCAGTDCTINLGSPLAPAANYGLLTTIDGATGANTITINGNYQTPLLTVGGGVNLAVNNLNFTRGSNSRDNYGGAIGVSGTLTLTNSALFNNSAQYGGALATRNGGTTNLTNVTISGSAAQYGGGIYNAATTSATNCTVSNNSAQYNGGVSNESNATFNLRNTLIAGNTASQTIAPSPDANGNFSSQGYNLIGKIDGANGFGTTGDQTGTNSAPLDAKLAPLGDYGGKTLTHALLGSGATPSAAINTGTATNATTADQRGAVRIGTVDIGAFELNNSTNGGSFVSTLPTGMPNSAYQTQIAADSAGFTYSVTRGALPNGITLTSSFVQAGSVVLSGTPTQSGTFNFTITATNGTNSNVTDYQIQILGPTAANVSISGRVFAANRGLTNAIVTFTAQNGTTRTARTNAFGYFTIGEVASGATYLVNVSAKGRTFAPQIVSVTGSIANLNFTAQ